MRKGRFSIQSSLQRFGFVGWSWDALSFRPDAAGTPPYIVLDSGVAIPGFSCPKCGSSLINGSGRTLLSEALERDIAFEDVT